jgi:hypothetical protein
MGRVTAGPHYGWALIWSDHVMVGPPPHMAGPRYDRAVIQSGHAKARLYMQQRASGARRARRCCRARGALLRCNNAIAVLLQCNNAIAVLLQCSRALSAASARRTRRVRGGVARRTRRCRGAVARRTRRCCAANAAVFQGARRTRRCRGAVARRTWRCCTVRGERGGVAALLRGARRLGLVGKAKAGVESFDLDGVGSIPAILPRQFTCFIDELN